MGTKRKCFEQNEYNSKYPITPDMHKTSPEYCQNCEYHSYTCCDYIGITHESRKCPIGWCNKYKKRVTKRHYRFA